MQMNRAASSSSATIPMVQTNPFPSMLILLEGKADAKIGGKNIVLEKGPMLFIRAIRQDILQFRARVLATCSSPKHYSGK